MRRPARRPARDASARPARAVHAAVRLLMPSRRDAVAPMVDSILEAAQPAELDDEQTENLAVALAEALSNAAVHGNRLRADTPVRVAVTARPGVDVAIDIADSGNGFNPEGVSDPTDEARLLVPGGRGVFLMRRLVDELVYNAAGNHVRMTVRARRSGHAG